MRALFKQSIKYYSFGTSVISSLVNQGLAVCCLLQIGALICNSVILSEQINYNLHLNSYVIIFLIITSLSLNGVIKHYLCIAFYVCFFIFLMGQKLFLEDYKTFLTFTATTLNVSQYLTFISVISIAEIFTFVSYKYYIKKKRIYPCQKVNNNWRFLLPLVRVLFYLTLPCALYMQLKIVIFKSAFLYTSGYLENVDVPTIIKIGNFLFSALAIIYLAMKPSRREVTIVCIALIFLGGVVQLFQGRRALFASTFLFLVWYYIKYKNITKLGGRNLVISFLGIIGIVSLFFYIENSRDASRGEISSIFLILQLFLISTGGSDSVLANTIVNEAAFPKSGVLYLIDPVINNPISIIFLGKSGVAQGEAYLDNFNTFSHWISYLTQPSLYLSGHGMGSCYLAEVYLAFGIIGVIGVAFFIGFILSKLAKFNFDNHRIFINSIYFLLIKSIFTLPRDGLFSWFSSFVYLMLVFVLLLFFLPKMKRLR